MSLKMSLRKAFSIGLFGSVVLTAGCGSDEGEVEVRWELSIAGVSGNTFGVRILLDGRTVLDHAATASQHSTTVSGAYSRSEHVVEYEILSPSRELASYVGSVQYEIPSTGTAAIVDGVPTQLRAGERLRIVVSLAPDTGV